MKCAWLRPGPGIHDDEPLEDGRIEHGAGESDRSPPVLADHGKSYQSKSTNEFSEVRDVVFQAEIMFARGPLRKAETNVVGSNDPKARRNEGRNEFAVQKRPGGIAMQKQNHLVVSVPQIHTA